MTNSIKIERAQISGMVLKGTTAKGGETLEEVGKRTNNQVTALFTAIMNGLPDGATLQEGQPLKIANKQAYFKKD